MNALDHWLPHTLTLPRDDPKPDRRARQLAEARQTWRYTWDKPNLHGVAMADGVPAADQPSAAWLVEVAGAIGRLTVNALEDDDLAHLRGARHSAVALSHGLGRAAQAAVEDVLEGTRREPLSRRGGFLEHFRTLPVPPVSAELGLDATFARMRLAGPNPAWIHQVRPADGLPDALAVTDAHLTATLPGDTLAAALAEGRLYLADYTVLADVPSGALPAPPPLHPAPPSAAARAASWRAREAAYAQAPHPKAHVAPLALFCLDRTARALHPVAIQLHPRGHGGRHHPVFTPRDGLDWVAAKAAVQAADGTVHETRSHLAETHLVQEAFCLAMRRNLSERHPLHRLLVPHFEGTLNINQEADALLVNPGGFVDALLLPTIGGSIQLAADALRDFNFAESLLPRQLEARGVADPAHLPGYPYRDDGLLVWRALERWVRGYVGLYYAGDADVLADVELQAFVREVGSPPHEGPDGQRVGGGLRGVQEGAGGVQTRRWLIQLLTQVIWNGSGQHAAVNFPQAGPMIYAPNQPLTLMGAPTGQRPTTRPEYLAMLPHERSARLQVFVLGLLGGVHHTRLGHYPAGWFGLTPLRQTPVEALLDRLKADLRDIEETLVARDRERVPYPWLRPSRIPQSINI